MSRLSKLHRNPKHELAENTLFIKRLRFKLADENPTRIDCVNLMQQYHHLYIAMEIRLAELNAKEPLDFFNKEPWAFRSQLLENDIKEMTHLLSKPAKENIDNSELIYPAVQTMLDEIKIANSNQLMAYYAVRCLGDVFGGQHLHTYNQRSFEPKPLTGSFYNSVKGSMKSIARFINNQELFSATEDRAFLQAADQVFQNHLDLFKELELERTPQVNDSLAKSINYSTCLRYGLFTVATAACTAVAYIASTSEDTMTL